VDLLMLVLMEGRDRTAEEYTTLLLESGFAVKSVAAPGPPVRVKSRTSTDIVRCK
jgi:hypothetical protein